MPVHINELQVKGGGASTAGAKSDVFLSITTKRAGKIKGEATTEGHADEIIVSSWGWGVASNTAIGSTQATARRAYKHLVIVKTVDAASTPLMSALATNDEVKEAKLTMRKAGGEALDYFTMTLAKARIVNLDIEVGADGLPHEHIAIAFAKIDVEYQRQQGAGASSGTTTFSDEWADAS